MTKHRPLTEAEIAALTDAERTKLFSEEYERMVADGLAERVIGEDGEIRYRLTEKGIRFGRLLAATSN